MNSLSFPCIICDTELERVTEGNEAQPNDGIMCETGGNYGSTVWDEMNGNRLAFNICDACMIAAGEQGRVMTYRKFQPICVERGKALLHVGYMDLNTRGYVPWRVDLPGDDEPLVLGLDELDNLPKQCHLSMTPDVIRSCIKSYELEQQKRRQADVGRAIDVRGD